MYQSQWQQDQWLNENVFHNKKNGVFVDVGAHDGVDINNTYFYEKELEWTGICVEPIPNIYQKLRDNRSAKCVHGCAYNKNGTVKFQWLDGYTEMLSGIEETYNSKHCDRVDRELKQHGGNRTLIEVPCYTLEKLLEDSNITHIDYLSIDTEGSEMQVLEGINFDRVKIDVIEVENNYPEELPMFNKFLNEKGFEMGGRLTGDVIYFNKDVFILNENGVKRKS